MRTNRLIALFTCAIAIAAGIAAGAGVFLRGSGATTSVLSVRGEAYEMATDGVRCADWEQGVHTLISCLRPVLVGAVGA